jgi:hypothetical protein
MSDELYRRLVKHLNQAGLFDRYAIIGNIAALLHGARPLTFDLDILVEMDEEVIEKLIEVLHKLNYQISIDKEDKLREFRMVILYSPHDLDIAFSITGFPSFRHIRREVVDWEGLKVPVIALDDLIKK